MTKILLTWIGETDLKAAKGEDVGLGPIGQAVTERDFDKIFLISNYPEAENSRYKAWLETKTTCKIKVLYKELKKENVMDYEKIYKVVFPIVRKIREVEGPLAKLIFHLSPGTPAMHSIWVILAKTRFTDSELISSARGKGVRTVDFPFDISAEFLPKPVQYLENLSIGTTPETVEFKKIIHRSPIMTELIAMAQHTARLPDPILIEGETGTGKELFARAIHYASSRSNKKPVTVNCGAIPKDLVESQLFGHVKGAFTGAVKDNTGYFEVANGNTIFLDEIGELPLATQVKLLRVLQEKEITKVGDTKPKKIDVRIIAATNRNLINEVAAGRFRDDLYFRLSTIILKIPPLREREGDINLLIDALFNEIKEGSGPDSGFKGKEFSPSARNLLLTYEWPGNVRELRSTIVRAAFWSSLRSKGNKIDEEDVRYALSQALPKKDSEILNRLIGNGFNLEELITQVAHHYLSRAIKETHGNKSEAAKLVGLPSYQTFSNWMKKFKVDEKA